MKFFSLLCGCLFLCVSTQAAEVRRAEPVDSWGGAASNPSSEVNDTARFIAGMPPIAQQGPLMEWSQTPEWITFAQAIDDSWQRFEINHLDPIRDWRAANLADLNPDTVFYPFSGPDAAHARILFPNASTYILCGLEPTGTPPTLQDIQPLSSTLGWMQVSVKTLMEAGYFVTKEMKTQFKQSPLQGTVPVLCFMMVRNGDHIVSVQSDASHAEIRFLAPGDTRVRTLHYFSLNLRNDGLRKGSDFLAFVKASHPDVGYLKSASYLLHENDFSTIRDTLLTQCRAILQDDSGIPLREFKPDRWRVRNFGVYAAPLDIFKKYNQPDLADLYAKLPSTPLPFGVGYHWNPKTANLMLFTTTDAR